MILIAPYKVGPDELVSTNVPISEIEWSEGVEYTRGDRAYIGIVLYEAVADNPTERPDADTNEWVRVGAINQQKMFTNQLSDPTTNENGITVEIQMVEAITGIAFFGLRGSSVAVTLIDENEGPIYEREITLQDFTLVTDWHSYLFSPITQKRELILTDLPTYRNALLRVEIKSTTVAECALLTVGSQKLIGETKYGGSIRIIDFTDKPRNEFGEFDVTERGYSKRVGYPVQIETARVPGVFSLLAQQRAVPSVYVGSIDNEATYAIGYYRDYEMVFEGPNSSTYEIDIEGLN